MTVTQLSALHEKLKNLRIEHRGLDQQILDREQQPYLDTLELRRMKKHKLIIKETIVKLESQLIPDLNA